MDAILKAPEPKNTTELRSFLGLVNYYGKFIKNLSTLTHSLNHLLRKGATWKWSAKCRKAFQKLKKKLASTEVLVHYNPQLPIKLDCDASAYGIGAVISHVFPDKTERPIAYTSRTLTAPERNYPQIEKEALALVNGVKKFHQFLFGRHFILVTDHKPLTTILGPKKGLPTLAAARLQRWAMFLSNYRYDLEFRKTERHCNADGFSRLPLPDTECNEEDVAYVFNHSQIAMLPVDAAKLRKATRVDPVLSKVLVHTKEGWPKQSTERNPDLQPYFQWRHEITIEAGCLLWGMCVIVPRAYQQAVLAELHTSHPGIVRMKSLAWTHTWWPSIDKHIEQMVHNCASCRSIRNAPPKAEMHPWAWPDSPWRRIHVDFAGPFLGSYFMVIVDAHSKWLEVYPMKSITTSKTLEILRNLFAAYGLPYQIVSDNGPQFVSTEFETCMKTNGIKHIRVAPYHPSLNGEAECFVQTFKRAMKAVRNDEGTLQMKLAKFLLSYRSTPHCTTGVSPAELFLKRPVRTRLDLLRPTVESKVLQKQADQKNTHDNHSKSHSFNVGQSVLARNLRGEPKWVLRCVVEQTGPVSYKIQVGDIIWRRHTDQLLDLKSSPLPTESGVVVPNSENVTVGTRPPEVPLPTTPGSITSQSVELSNQSVEPSNQSVELSNQSVEPSNQSVELSCPPTVPDLRRSSRSRKQPDRLIEHPNIYLVRGSVVYFN